MVSAVDIKRDLTNKLKKEHCFWSFQPSSVQDIADDVLIEKVLVYLDMPDIDKLFVIYPHHKVKQVWREYLVPQEEYYHSLNRFLAWWYFDIKRPDSYLKAMNTRRLNKWLR